MIPQIEPGWVQYERKVKLPRSYLTSLVRSSIAATEGFNEIEDRHRMSEEEAKGRGLLPGVLEHKVEGFSSACARRVALQHIVEPVPTPYVEINPRALGPGESFADYTIRIVTTELPEDPEERRRWAREVRMNVTACYGPHDYVRSAPIHDVVHGLKGIKKSARLATLGSANKEYCSDMKKYVKRTGQAILKLARALPFGRRSKKRAGRYVGPADLGVVTDALMHQRS